MRCQMPLQTYLGHWVTKRQRQLATALRHISGRHQWLQAVASARVHVRFHNKVHTPPSKPTKITYDKDKQKPVVK